MKDPHLLIGAFFALAACNQPQTSSFYISGVVDETPTQVVNDLNALPIEVGLTKDRYWRQHGVVLRSEKRTLVGDSGEDTGSFKDDIQTYWSPAGEDKGKLPVYIGLRSIDMKTRIQISAGGPHVTAERVPASTMRRLASWLKGKYGAERFAACENAFC